MSNNAEQSEMSNNTLAFLSMCFLAASFHIMDRAEGRECGGVSIGGAGDGSDPHSLLYYKYQEKNKSAHSIYIHLRKFTYKCGCLMVLNVVQRNCFI